MYTQGTLQFNNFQCFFLYIGLLVIKHFNRNIPDKGSSNNLYRFTNPNNILICADPPTNPKMSQLEQSYLICPLYKSVQIIGRSLSKHCMKTLEITGLMRDPKANTTVIYINFDWYFLLDVT